MSRVLVLGKDGMLGHAVSQVLKDAGHDVTGTARADFDAITVMQGYKDRRGVDTRLRLLLSLFDYVVNAIGVTIPRSLDNPAETLFVNGALPHILAGILGRRLIHITTDCVYSGTDGGAPYDELSLKSPVDLYGLSKSIGEPQNCVTIRTSIIGRELKGYTGLLEWFLRHPAGEVNGFTNHFWNGVTTYEFGSLCNRIIRDGLAPGVYHWHSNDVSKYEMLLEFQQRYKTDHVIMPTVAPTTIDRRLAATKLLYTPLSFADMVDMMP